MKLEDLINTEDCLQYVSEKIFPLRSVEYGKKYPIWPGQVGIEIEMLPLQQKDGKSSILPMRSGDVNLESFLRQARQEKWRIDEDGGRIVRVALEEKDQLTFEPGGQLEFSSSPYPCLTDALERMRSVQSVLLQAAEKMNISIKQSGINPWQTPHEIGLQMDKPRYQAMTDYFNRIGPYGIRMMRQTCTIQVNLDFGPSEDIMLKRFLLSQLVSPIATAIFSNSPCADGKLTPFKSFRSNIWQNVDPSRTGFDRGLSNITLNSGKSDLVENYLNFILDAPVVFVEKAGFKIPPRDFTFRKWMADGFENHFPRLKDFETHLSLHFPEVRLRGFLELRSMDAQSRIWQSVPAGFLTALFYDEKACDRALELLLPFHGREEELWKKSSYGLEDKELWEVASQVFQISEEGLQRLPSCFREGFEASKMHIYWENFVSRRRTPADDMIDIVKEKEEIPADVFAMLNDKWFQY